MAELSRISPKPATNRRPSVGFLRIPPTVRDKIHRMAKEGYTDMDISRECSVSRHTARKYSAQVRPAPDYKIRFDESDIRILHAVAEHAVKVRCPKCRILTLGFAFVPATRCVKCGMTVAVPFDPPK